MRERKTEMLFGIRCTPTQKKLILKTHAKVQKKHKLYSYTLSEFCMDSLTLHCEAINKKKGGK